MNQCTKHCRMHFCNSRECKYGLSDNSPIDGIFHFFSDKCTCISSDSKQTLGVIPRKYSFYNTTQQDVKMTNFCGIKMGQVKTFENKEELISQNYTILHLGNCGECSNEHDLQIYKNTAMTLTGLATKCAVYRLLFGTKAALNCIHQNIGFTKNCATCWLQNMECTATHCLWTCLLGDKNSTQGLTPCHACDEYHCGGRSKFGGEDDYGFRGCAGLTRRRAGIITDIKREQYEIYQNQ